MRTLINDPDAARATLPGLYHGPIINDPDVVDVKGSALLVDGIAVDTSPRTADEIAREIEAWRETFRALDARRAAARIVRR